MCESDDLPLIGETNFNSFKIFVFSLEPVNKFLNMFVGLRKAVKLISNRDNSAALILRRIEQVLQEEVEDSLT